MSVVCVWDGVISFHARTTPTCTAFTFTTGNIYNIRLIVGIQYNVSEKEKDRKEKDSKSSKEKDKKGKNKKTKTGIQ